MPLSEEEIAANIAAYKADHKPRGNPKGSKKTSHATNIPIEERIAHSLEEIVLILQSISSNPLT